VPQFTAQTGPNKKRQECGQNTRVSSELSLRTCSLRSEHVQQAFCERMLHCKTSMYSKHFASAWCTAKRNEHVQQAFRERMLRISPPCSDAVEAKGARMRKTNHRSPTQEQTLSRAQCSELCGGAQPAHNLSWPYGVSASAVAGRSHPCMDNPGQA
jgi:hypothetical protein